MTDCTNVAPNFVQNQAGLHSRVRIYAKSLAAMNLSPEKHQLNPVIVCQFSVKTESQYVRLSNIHPYIV